MINEKFHARAVSIHEAGHAVAGFVHGRKILSIAVNPQKRAGGVRFHDDNCRWRVHVFTALAGPAAQRYFDTAGETLISPNGQPSDASDMHKASIALSAALEECQIDDDNELDRRLSIWKSHADRWVRRDAIWQSIKQLAEAIESGGWELSGDAATAALNQSTGLQIRRSPLHPCVSDSPRAREKS